ncbi:hypothetical protein P3S68_027771 [Capsicum galapagoense]
MATTHTKTDDAKALATVPPPIFCDIRKLAANGNVGHIRRQYIPQIHGIILYNVVAIRVSSYGPSCHILFAMCALTYVTSTYMFGFNLAGIFSDKARPFIIAEEYFHSIYASRNFEASCFNSVNSPKGTPCSPHASLERALVQTSPLFPSNFASKSAG